MPHYTLSVQVLQQKNLKNLPPRRRALVVKLHSPGPIVKY